VKNLIIIIALLCMFGERASAQDFVQSLSTVSGELKIVDRNTSFSVVLGERTIYQQEWDTFKGFAAPRYNFGDTDVVLLYISGGGSSSGSFYKVITIRKNGSTSVSPSEFIGTGAPPRVTRKENSLTIYFPTASTVPEGRRPAETWVWQGGQLKRLRTRRR
jgi:hypothetical protein